MDMKPHDIAAAAERTESRARANPPIADYAIIGDCRSAALISRCGSIDWLCWPHFSAPSVFAAVLDPERGGHFSITPTGRFKASRRYAGETAVLETTFATQSGSVRLTEAMIIGQSARNLEPLREIIRMVEGIDGAVSLDVDFAPRPGYAESVARIRGRAGDWNCSWGNEVFRLRSDHALDPREGGAGGHLVVGAGERYCFSLSYEKAHIAILLPTGKRAAERIDRTVTWWQEWAKNCCANGPYRNAVLRSAITLKLMTFALSGAVVAAPTASLPEWIGGSRNYDYRYCWLRDAALTMRAFTGLGLREEAGVFLRWLLHATRLTRPRLGVVYDVFGRMDLGERELAHLSGYRRSKPVRIGNAAQKQMQLDVYGGVIAAAWEFATNCGSLQRDQCNLLAGFGRTVRDCWREPDHGIWEIRDRKRHYTFSKLMCWTALDRLLALQRSHGLHVATDRFEEERSAIAETIETKGFNEELASYVMELEGDRVDASLLLMPCLGYGNPEDPRMRTTFERIDERLGRDGLLYRYEPNVDGIPGPEGAFGIASFWAVENLARRGDPDGARQRFEKLNGYANDVGLFAEEIEPDSGAALGNFPQAFTHVGLINAALAIDKALEDRGDGDV